MGAHVAALGVRFYTSTGPKKFPSQFENAAVIAEHGSWNRSKLAGYKVSIVKMTGDSASVQSCSNLQTE